MRLAVSALMICPGLSGAMWDRFGAICENAVADDDLAFVNTGLLLLNDDVSVGGLVL